MNFCACRKSASLAAPSPPWSVTIVPFSLGGRGSADSTSVFEPCSPIAAGVHADVARRLRLHRLLLRAHDPLQRRVARLVDALDHRHDRGQRALHDRVAALLLAVDRDRRAVDVHLLGVRQAGQLQVLGHRLRNERRARVGRLGSHEHQVELHAAERLRQHLRRGHRVGAVQARVAHQDAAVGAERQRLADRVLLGALGPHGQHRDLAAVLLLQAERLFDRVFVDRVDDAVDRLAVEGKVLWIEDLVRGRIRHSLDAHDDVHESSTMSGRAPAARRF